MNHVTHALRQLLRRPLLSAAAIISLSLAIGANTALFSVFDRLILRPHSFEDSSTLVRVWTNNTKLNFVGPQQSLMKYELIRDQNNVFSHIAASTFASFAFSRDNNDPEQILGQRVTQDFFPTLGVKPLLGRNFIADEDREGAPPVVIVTHEFWQTRLNGREKAVGESIKLNGMAYEIVGVLPPHLSNPWSSSLIFITHSKEPPGLLPSQVQAGATYLQITARMKPGVTLERANENVALINARYGKEFANRMDAQNPTDVKTLTQELAGSLTVTMNTLLAAVGAVLLIACANVSNLFLASLSARNKEIAVRLSMGAARRHLLQQFLTESLLIAVMAAFLGSILGRVALVGIQSAAVNQLPPNTTFEFGWPTYLFLVGIAVLTTLLVGLVPALQASKVGLSDVLKDSARGAPGGTRGSRFRAGLIVVQVAASVVLLIGSALLLVSFYRLQATPSGLRTTGVATSFVAAPIERYKTAGEQSEFYRRVVERLKTMPQIKNAGIAFGLPLNGSPIAPYTIFGTQVKPLAERPLANLHIVDAEFFDTLGIPLKEGRFITERDREGTPFVCLINESFAKRIFPKESAVGKILLRGREAEIQVQIIGVVADVKSNGLNTQAPDAIYYAFSQMGKPGTNIIARVEGDPNALQPLMRTAVASVDSNQPIAFFQTMDQLLQQSTGFQELVAQLTSIFAIVALVLTAVGLYSVIAYAVSQRTNEMGLRLALGASPAQVLALVVSQGMRLVILGLVIGLAAAAGSSRLIASLLFSISPIHPPIYGAVSFVFVAIALVACAIPARRASQIDPLVALRIE